MKKLSEKWQELIQETDVRYKKLEDVHRKMMGLEKQMECLNERLAEFETANWIPVQDIPGEQLAIQLVETAVVKFLS